MNERRKWYLLELNQGHMDFQSIALPPELRYRVAMFKTVVFLIASAKVVLFLKPNKFFLKNFSMFKKKDQVIDKSTTWPFFWSG